VCGHCVVATGGTCVWSSSTNITLCRIVVADGQIFCIISMYMDLENVNSVHVFINKKRITTI
jgi:hypothetical protein